MTALVQSDFESVLMHEVVFVVVSRAQSALAVVLLALVPCYCCIACFLPLSFGICGIFFL